MTFDSPVFYLQKTEHAVKHLYKGIESCWEYYKRANEYWNFSRVNEPKTPEYREDLENYLKLAGEYCDLKFSEATFAGAILQTAAMGIKCFSKNKTIPECCNKIISSKDKIATRFCIGKELYGLPVGLIIYATRNQYNHWDEEPKEKTEAIFDKLTEAFIENPLYDLAFELDNPTITIYSNEVLLGALEWTTYEIYYSEMLELLSV